jgi:plastocyanin
MQKRLKLGAGALVLAGALLLAACGGGSGAKGGSPASGSPTSGSHRSGTSITISNFMFQPMSLTVSPGATVSVTNKDSATHTLTATGNEFNTGDIVQNHTKTFTAPMKPGTYNYICNIHQFMMGTITVK